MARLTICRCASWWRVSGGKSLKSSSQPKWIARGYQSEAAYEERCRSCYIVKRVALKASQATGKAETVLSVLWGVRHRDETAVAVHVVVLMERAKASRMTVQRALRFLEAEGSISRIYNQLGGAGKKVTYALRVAGQGEKSLLQYERELDWTARCKSTWRYLRSKYPPEDAERIMEERGLTPPPK